MRTSLLKRNYTIRQAAWLLGVEPARVSRAIRLGTLRAEARGGRLVIPANVIVRLLSESGGAPWQTP